MFVALNLTCASLASPKRFASLSGCESVGSGECLCAHWAYILPHDATCNRGNRCKESPPFEKKLDRLRDDGLTPRRIGGGAVARYVAGRRVRHVDALR